MRLEEFLKLNDFESKFKLTGSRLWGLHGKGSDYDYYGDICTVMSFIGMLPADIEVKEADYFVGFYIMLEDAKINLFIVQTYDIFNWEKAGEIMQNLTTNNILTQGSSRNQVHGTFEQLRGIIKSLKSN